jgi:Mn2+/Fe2+ NRAMP family transporter
MAGDSRGGYPGLQCVRFAESRQKEKDDMTEQCRDSTAVAESSASERDRQLLIDARKKGRLSTLGAFARLSGPGWIQSAITLGSGTLSSALYLGILGGMAFLWLQPLAMIMGVIMLSAIGYVTLSTGEKPFRAINQHINPVLGWGWIIATMLANLVWCLPQYAVGTAGVRQNLLPGLVGADAIRSLGWPDWAGNAIVVAGITLLCMAVVIFYDRGRRGIRLLEWVLKAMVAVIVVSFIGVVVMMSFSRQGLDWRQILSGLVPDLNLLSRPAGTFNAALGAVSEQFRGFWSDKIVADQRDVMISAAANAVGINMTFLLPYSMLRKGWGRNFKGLAMFDLSTGLLIPFILVTGCIVIASSAQFHNRPAQGVFEGTAPKAMMSRYEALATERVQKEMPPAQFAAVTKDELAVRIKALPEVEQPFPYDLQRHAIDVRSVSARKPLFMDESAHDWRLVMLGRSLGWTGVALKTCKTQTGALLSLCWAKAHGMTLMVQDLTNPMLAQIPHCLLAAHAGTIMGVETNAMQFYPEASRREAAIHPGLYTRRNGQIDLCTIQGSGFGYGVSGMPV